MLAGHSSTVKWQTGLCPEHMICPLPRASELSALRAVGVQAIGTQGGADGPRRDRSGAGHETAGSHHAALSGALTWLQAADILGMELRSLRSCRARFEAGGAAALYDRRRSPSPRKAPRSRCSACSGCTASASLAERAPLLPVARRDHGVTSSYSLCKLALQEAGLVRRHRAPRPAPRRREPRACLGEMLHLDGSRHARLRRRPDAQQTLITVLDDATKRLLYAQLRPAEIRGRPDRAAHGVRAPRPARSAVHLPRRLGLPYPAGRGPRRPHPADPGRPRPRAPRDRAHRLLLPAGPRAERARRTAPCRGGFINELALAGITTVEAANGYLTERFLPDYDAEFAHSPADLMPAFVPPHGVDLDAILCHLEERTVGRDNIVVLNDVPLQVPKQPGRRAVPARGRPCGATCTTSTPRARRPAVWGRFDARGRPLASTEQTRAHRPPDRRALGRPSLPRPGSGRPLNVAAARACPSARAPDRQITCQNQADRSLVNNSGRQA